MGDYVIKRLDLERFSTEDLLKEPFWERTASLINIRSELEMRKEYITDSMMVEFVDTDIMIWGRGEPECIESSKIGGGPVFQNSRIEEVSGLFFVGQIFLGDSKAICKPLAKTTKDVLSIWSDAEFPYGSIKAFLLESKNLEKTPDSKTLPYLEKCGVFFGARFRTTDVRIVDGQDIFPVEVEYEWGSSYYSPGAWNATKIGGIHEQEIANKEFIVSLDSIQAEPDVVFPWVNVEKPLSVCDSDDSYTSEKNAFVFGDLGKINFFVDSNLMISTNFGIE